MAWPASTHPPVRLAQLLRQQVVDLGVGEVLLGGVVLELLHVDVPRGRVELVEGRAGQRGRRWVKQGREQGRGGRGRHLHHGGRVVVLRDRHLRYSIPTARGGEERGKGKGKRKREKQSLNE